MRWRHGTDPPWWWKPWITPLAWMRGWWERPRPVKMIEVSARRGRRLFDRHCRELLGIPGEEFLRRLDAGELDMDDPAVFQLRMIEPFGR